MHRERLAKLRSQFDRWGVDAVLVPRFDEHQGEYCAPHDERLAFLTGFSGSAGMCIVLRERAVIFVDGRYQVQVRQETDAASFEIAHLIDRPVERWLEQEAQSGLRLGLNTMLVPSGLYERVERSVGRLGGTVVALAVDPIDAIWVDQPDKPVGRIYPMPVDRAGESSASKRARVAERLRDARAGLLVETQPDNIAWLLNLRGADVAFTTAPHSFLLMDDSGAIEWFVDARKLPNDRGTLEISDVALSDPAALLSHIAERANGRTVMVDPDQASVALPLAVKEGGGRVDAQMSPITLLKAHKNPVELQGFRDCHIEDGAAWTNFNAWLLREAPRRAAAGKPISEMEVEDRILAFRQRSPSFIGASFHSISAAGSNAAMCHYSSSPATDAALTDGAPFLLDSGGHYLTGTTDATRTVGLGPQSVAVRTAYTGVLKGFLAMLTLRFPSGTYGHQIDAFARKALWDLGLDFDHGTGHGVGHVGAIHEGPHRITRSPNPFRIEAGIVLTVEPGYYSAGEFGIRIENQVEVVEEAGGFLRLRSLTHIPIATDMIDLTALTADEIAFLDAYHADVRASLLDRVLPETQDYLVKATAPLSAARREYF
jgi:Xaa-Pro aminopeptidase